MRLDYVPHSLSFEIERESLNFISFENSVHFENVVFDLHETVSFGEDKVRMWEDGSIIDLHRTGDIITTPFDVNFDRREIQKKALELFSSELRYCGIEELFAEINHNLLKMISETEVMFDFALEYSESISINEVLKSVGVRLKEPEGTFIERLTEYVHCLHRIGGKSEFFLINCNAYLREGDNTLLEDFAKQEKVDIVQIEGAVRRAGGEEDGAKVTIIDDDGCELYI